MNPNIKMLQPQHLDDLRKSGLSDSQIERCGFYSEPDPVVWSKLLKWDNPPKQGSTALCIPYFDAAGNSLDYTRVKCDSPRKLRGKANPIKYESPIGSPNRLYIPPGTRDVIQDSSVRLVITEGEKKAAKADQEGFPCLGLVGVYGWQVGRPKNAKGKGEGKRELIPDLASIRWQGRFVWIIFDSDAAQNQNVKRAEYHLAQVLKVLGAVVCIVRLPSASDGVKVGLDDFLIAHGPSALQLMLDPAQPELQQPQNDSKVRVIIGTDEHRVCDEAITGLSSEADLYQRGEMLVVVKDHVKPKSSSKVIRQLVGAPVLRTLSRASLRDRLSRCVEWLRNRDENGESVESLCHPPGWAVNAILERGIWPGIKQLDALVTHPVVLPDGKILMQNGFDESHGLLIAIPPDLSLTVPANPTKREIEAAVAIIEDVLADFPFQSPAHRGAWYAGLLTPICWFAFDGCAPLFLIQANVRGAGKGLLADVIALIVTGRRFAAMGYTPDSEELRKRITALAVEGERTVLLDNLAGTIGNDIFDAALTATTWNDRILSASKVYNGPLNLIWYGTGNNTEFRADTSRRVCPIRMESIDEHPELKANFRHEKLRPYVMQNRGKLLSAALTLVRGWFAAGQPVQKLTSWGSYESWSDVVRQIVVFAGLTDPALGRYEMRSMADRDAVAMVTILHELKRMDELGRGLTVSEIVARIKGGETTWTDLSEAVEELCGKVSGLLIASKFRHFVRRNFDGLYIDRAGNDRRNSMRWIVVDTWKTKWCQTTPSSPSSPAYGSNTDDGDDGDAGQNPSADELKVFFQSH